MEYKLVVLGIVLLLVGLVAYSSIPNVQRTPVLTTQSILGPDAVHVMGGRSEVIAKNITVFQGKQNDLKVNVTVTTESGELGSLRFLVFPRNNSFSCTTSRPVIFLLDRAVSNETLLAPVNTTGAYCFVFDNEDYPTSKVASVIASLDTRSEKVSVTKDGGANMAGLGLGALGFLLALYGVTRKAVIPWE